MTQEQRILLSVLRHALDPNMPLPEVSNCDWEAVLQEAQQQTVSLIFYDAVAPLLPQMPAPVQQKIMGTGMQVVATNVNIGNTQAGLTALLQAEHIPHLILKGEASAAYYPNPQLRTLGDVDFLVEPENFSTVHEIFQRLGYRFDEHQHDHHIAYHTPSGVLEMHRHLPGIPHGTPGAILNVSLENLLQRTQTLNIGSGDFSAPEPGLHGLILLLHMQHHLVSEGIGLRHLMDWGCYVNHTIGDSFWSASLLPLLKRIGLFTFAAVMTGICSRTLGTACPNWAVNADEALCNDILEDILSGGNFGRKDKIRSASGLMVSNAGKDGTKRSKAFNLWNTFHRSVQGRYPIVKRCPLLYIVFYPVRAVRYFFKILTGKRGSIIKAIPQANQRRDLYGQLHIFEVEENG